LYNATYYALYLKFANARNEKKLICTLETGMYKAMKEKHYSAIVSNAKVLMKLVGLATKIKS
tara:strand:+ start:458 stop:643 length:186 start_codon:yes stop_codon:yes gene_type:complete